MQSRIFLEIVMLLKTFLTIVPLGIQKVFTRIDGGQFVTFLLFMRKRIILFHSKKEESLFSPKSHNFKVIFFHDKRGNFMQRIKYGETHYNYTCNDDPCGYFRNESGNTSVEHRVSSHSVVLRSDIPLSSYFFRILDQSIP